MIILFYLIWSLFLKATFEQEEECNHPSNYSDFTLLLVNNTLIATGGNTNSIEVWTQNISNGFDTTKNCWIHATPTINNTSEIAIDIYSSYKNGIGFALSNSTFATQAGDNAALSMTNLSLFDLTTNTWSTPSVQGIHPSPRSRMSVAVNTTTNIAWFYGGRTQITEQPTHYFNSFYSFNMKSFIWNWPETFYSGGQRPARYGHSSNLISERLFILGGKTAVYSNDSSCWTVSPGDFLSILVYDTNTHQAISMATIGDIPPARYSFSTVNAPDGRSIVLFGGQNVSSEETFDATNDVYILDTCTLNWSRPIIKGAPPIPRAGHEAVVYRNRYMIAYMGIQNYFPSMGPVYVDDAAILDMKTWKWVSSIPQESEDNGAQVAKCRFNFPIVVFKGDNDNDNNGVNATVVSSSNKSSITNKLAFGITFGVLGLILFITGAIVFIFRIRRDVDAKQNPRWLPNVLKRKRDTPSLSS